MTKDEITSTAPWEFNEEVAEVFPDMLERSIPGYFDMRESTIRMCFPYSYKGVVLDLGCSDGQMVEYLRARAPPAEITMIDRSQPMLDKCLEKFKDAPEVTIINQDLTKPLGLMKEHYTCALSILTLQFVPYDARLKLLRQVYNSLKPGGVLLIVEKLEIPDKVMHERFTMTYHFMKHDHGYTWDQISSKAKALEGVLIPTTEADNIDMLKKAGFSKVEPYWRSLQFAGYIAVKN